MGNMSFQVTQFCVCGKRISSHAWKCIQTRWWLTYSWNTEENQEKLIASYKGQEVGTEAACQLEAKEGLSGKLWGEHKGRNWNLFTMRHGESHLTSWERKEEQAQQQCSCPPSYFTFLSHTGLLSVAFLFPFLCSSFAVWSPVLLMYLFILALLSVAQLPHSNSSASHKHSSLQISQRPCRTAWLWDALVWGGFTPSGADCLQARVVLHEPYAVTGCFSDLTLPSHSHRFTWKAFLNSWFLFP